MNFSYDLQNADLLKFAIFVVHLYINTAKKIIWEGSQKLNFQTAHVTL